MNIGSMRERVRIEGPAQTHASADSYGRTDTFSASSLPATVWANVEQIGGEKRYLDNTGRNFINYKITLRYNPDILLDSRIKWGSRYLYINDITGDKAGGTMVLMCYERATS